MCDFSSKSAKGKISYSFSQGKQFSVHILLFSKDSNAVISKLSVLQQGKDNSSLNYVFRCQIFSVVLRSYKNNPKMLGCSWKHSFKMN